MNLADAIRKASLGKPHETAEEPVHLVREPSVWDRLEPEHQEQPAQPESAGVTVEEPTVEATNEPSYPASAVGAAVRLELFLSPEQLSTLFRAVAANQHTMLTLRETASFLRVPASSLEQLAQDGHIPGFHIDGRWRFSKAAIEDWLAAQQQRKEVA